ncbi:MAG: glycoside hydrolase family 2 TIM barrel-domain containing protein [Lachnospiraceae bacterium]|nr:glycoside hydrolase family 2 TIM barrel-domain containing protein [Lachnospiraceae bacterium]
MQNGILLNNNWKFAQGFDSALVTDPAREAGFETVHIPHTVQEIPYDCFDQYMTCMISSYVKYFDLEEFGDQRVIIVFEGVSAYFELYVNGQKVGEHKGAYSQSLFDLTDYVKAGENRMVLLVDSNERDDIPPNGSTVDYLIYGGIYRDVTLYVKPACYFLQNMARYTLSEDMKTATLQPELILSNHGEAAAREIRTTLLDAQGSVVAQWSETVQIPAGLARVMLAEKKLENIHLWDVEDPYLYELKTELLDVCGDGDEQHTAANASRGDEAGVVSAKVQEAAVVNGCDEAGTVVDTLQVSIGFRSIHVEPGGFYLNGRKIKLIGHNRHQSYPYVGYALGRRAQELDARLLKEFMDVNIVRCSHYMQSEYFLSACDRLGLMVFEEIPGWGFIGGEEFKKVVFQDLRNMVVSHFNHPGIVIWGTRLNETVDHDELYTATNALCKELDPSRPTTGVRWETGSNLIEDIYSYNDYTEDSKGEHMLLTRGQATESPKKVPYLISEHSGAMLPTKPFDSEERLEQFALRHARVIAKARNFEDYIGAIGWSLCDYNTHNDHNSLEKICHHGVLDMYRVPKWAAYVYASQKDPSKGIVMETTSMVGRGERCEPVPFFVLTNCDYVEVTLSTDITRRYYPSVKFAGLAHPPIEVTDNGEFWQHRWQGAVIRGFIGEECVAEKTISNNPKLDHMTVCVDDAELTSAYADATRVVAYFMDENENRLYYHQGVVSLEAGEGLEIVGPTLRSVLGGAVAFWVKSVPGTKVQAAQVTIHADRKELEDVQVEIALSGLQE